MNLSEMVRTELANKPPRIVVHGIHGIGKSTLAAWAPSPFFILAEDGLTSKMFEGEDKPPVPAHSPVATDLDEFFGYMEILIDEEHEYKTTVIDTADWLEKLIWAQVCKDENVSNIEDCGWGKGYIFAMNHWDKFFKGLEALRSKGLAVVVLAHNEIKKYDPPDNESYDRYQIKLHKHAAAKLEEWADAVLFANYAVYVDGKTKKAVNTDSDRVIHTTNRPAWRAKNRYGLPETMPLDFNILLEEIKK